MKKLSLLQILFIIGGIIWVGVFFGTVYMLPDIPKATEDETRRVIMQDTAIVKDLDFSKGKIIPGVQISEILTPNEKLLTLGAKSFKATCASCHGDEGKGDGAGGAMLIPKPRNFFDKEGWKNGRELTGMFKTIVEGIPGTGMNAYEFLPVEERFAIIYYIRSMTNDYPPITETEINGIDDIYDIQRDTKGGAQIPLKLAEQKVIELYEININKINEQLRNNNDKLFRVISCSKKAAITLFKDKTWKNDVADFTTLINANYYYNGFKPSVALLSKEDVLKLHQLLLTEFS